MTTTLITFFATLIVVLLFMASLVLKKLVKGKHETGDNIGIQHSEKEGDTCAFCGHYSNGGCSGKKTH